MDVVVERCAGLDVHRDNVVATVRVPATGRRQWEQQTQTFNATLAGLAALGAWLAQFGVTLVGMEATGVYWKTVFQALEERFECWLLNAHHLRNVPGRKTDVKDSEWICQLVQHGLVRPSFVPPPEIRRLRDLTRLRKAQSQRASPFDPATGEGPPGRGHQALKRRLDDLLEVRAGDARGAAGRDQRSRAARRARQGPDALRRSRSCARRWPAASRSSTTASWSRNCSRTSTRSTPRSPTSATGSPPCSTPHEDLIELLCTIPGVHVHAAQVLIAECGLDMTRFPTVKHFASWAGACPGHHESAGRRRSGRTRPGPRWLTDVLTECARAAVRTKGTYLAAHYAQLRGRRGEPIALGAIRHDLLVAYYHVVRDRVPYHDLGADWQHKRYSPEHRARRLRRQLEALGYKVELEQLEPAA